MAKVTMTNRELFALAIGCTQVGELKGVRFAYAVTKTKNKIQADAGAIEAAAIPSLVFREFDKKRIDLCKKHCTRDADDKPIITDDNTFEGLGPDFEAAYEQLEKANQEVVEARKKQLEDYKTLLNESVEVEVHQILLDDVPEDISPIQLEALMPMIKE